uniref:Sulfatase domain-containing protein n=1 Tax=Parastrongyloides trichosuri TaxID=131310 RepID=A0A0N4ZM65_PARTI
MIFILLFSLVYSSHQNINLTSHFPNVLQYEEFKLSIEKLKNISIPTPCTFKSYLVENKYYEFRKPYHIPPCRVNFVNDYVILRNGVLKYKNRNRNYFCKYQCNYPNGDLRIKFGKWTNIKGAPPDCDVFEVRCYNIIFKNIIFRDLFLQIYKMKEKPIEKITFLKNDYPVKEIKSKYNVHLILLDSISHYNLLRGLKRTKNYLEEEYSAVTFKYNNKIGSNSKPNAFGFLLNTRVQGLSGFSRTHQIKPSDLDVKGEDDCKSPVDNYPFIGKYYKQLNYTVYYAEDSRGHVISGNECAGFETQIPHHTLRPYTLRMHNRKFPNNQVYQNIHESKCRKHVNYQLKHLIKFMKTYEDSKQFTITWITRLSHNIMTGHFQYDKYLRRFFIENKNMFDKGFLIFMSDHGFRLGRYRNSEIGNFEDSNPFLMIAPPKELRNQHSEVVKNLKFNSEKHTSHFDIYATMLDIATEGSRNDFKNMIPFDFTSIVKNDTIKGLSLLREINQNRTCYEMEVSIEYCQCREKFLPYDQSIINQIYVDKKIPFALDSIVKIIKRNFVKELNRQLEIGKIKNYCEKMKENPNGLFEMKYAYNSEKQLIFFVKMEVFPKGIFEGYFNEIGEMSLSNIERIDKYSVHAEICLPTHRYRKFCYCKKKFRHH